MDDLTNTGLLIAGLYTFTAGLCCKRAILRYGVSGLGISLILASAVSAANNTWSIL